MSADRLRAMLGAATRGPWHLQLAAEVRLRTVKGAPDPERENDMGMGVAFNVEPADAALIALAPDAIALLADMGETLTALRAQVGITKHADGDTSSMVIGAHSFDAAGVTEILQRLDALCGDDRA